MAMSIISRNRKKPGKPSPKQLPMHKKPKNEEDGLTYGKNRLSFLSRSCVKRLRRTYKLNIDLLLI